MDIDKELRAGGSPGPTEARRRRKIIRQPAMAVFALVLLLVLSGHIGATPLKRWTPGWGCWNFQHNSSLQAIKLSIPSFKPRNAVQVPGDFVGFGFETAFLNDYAFGTFSENLVDSVGKRLGQPITIRVGGTSGDRVLFDPNLKVDKVCVAGDCPVGSGATYILGPSYFEGFKRFQNQLFSFQAPMDPVVNTTGSLDYVTRAWESIGPHRVAAIALGNEPDDYAAQSGAPYTAADYVAAATGLQSSIVRALHLFGGEERIFEAPDIASGEGGAFTLQDAFAAGLNRNGLIKFAADHYYQAPTTETTFDDAELQSFLMNHSAITSRFAVRYLPNAEFIESNDPQSSYIISESGSSLAGPPLTFQDAFGAALWAVDFLLYSMSVGVKRVDLSQRPAAHHSLWVPDNSTNSPSLGGEQNIGPTVRAPYFATPMVADFVGPASGSVVEVLSQDEATAYALYDSLTGRLSKVALVNLKLFSASDGTERGSTVFAVPVGQTARSVTVKRLHADAGVHAQGFDVDGADGIITWAGETWSFDLDQGNGHLTGAAQQEIVQVCGGVASITVPDSEAVIVFIEP